MNEKQHAVRTILLLDRTIRNEEVELARRTATAHATRCWSAPWMAPRKPTAVVATLNDTYITLKYGACAILEYSVCNDSDQYVSIIVVCVRFLFKGMNVMMQGPHTDHLRSTMLTNLPHIPLLPCLPRLLLRPAVLHQVSNVQH